MALLMIMVGYGRMGQGKGGAVEGWCRLIDNICSCKSTEHLVWKMAIKREKYVLFYLDNTAYYIQILGFVQCATAYCRALFMGANCMKIRCLFG